MKPTILDRWRITAEELTALVADNPSLRGVLLGYIAEKKFHDLYLTRPEIHDVGKTNDHDRVNKEDISFTYKGAKILVQVKSLQTNSVEKLEDGTWRGKTQVDASDKRLVELPNGEKVATTCLVAGGFDLLAVNLFAFGEEWRFAFALNEALPRSKWKGYKPRIRKYLLATLMEVTWPPQPPFFADPFPLLDELARGR